MARTTFARRPVVGSSFGKGQLREGYQLIVMGGARIMIDLRAADADHEIR